MNLINYEERRKLIKKVIKQNLKLTFAEIIILEKLKQLNKTKLDSTELKHSLFNRNMPFSVQLNNLITLGYLNKIRNETDERLIILSNINLEKIEQTLEQYHYIVKSILKNN
ncbi:MarR family transcriptional regulator [Staphylococcus sp. ACRSN]|uniref:transcriptional regulator, SarA/Rot family n=1 Tax=Staphylococcus sp. ACRSN TaxID=2918214 RepID=UPI001EF17FE8|nr:MarR family transcriptional regulator [Staphylococcus sp. ACRSN]MCG7339297.1 MarR family transcriptional regulator [Staphylococcus sp. ACRSN]